MIRLDFPWPPKQLMPNFKRSNHWSKYRKQTKAARTLGFGLTAQAVGAPLRRFAAIDRLRLFVVAQPPMRPGPTPDEDNLKGACKAYVDGIADALGCNDKNFRYAEMEWLPKSGDGAVYIGFELPDMEQR